MKQLIFLSFSLALVLSSCNKESDSLSPQDQAALNGLIESLNKATIENDSCIASIAVGDSMGLHYHDSLFHHFEGSFENHHNNYSHGNNHDDHGHHNGQIDSHNGGMNHGCCDGHHESQHDEMDDLINSHNTDVH